MFEKFNSDYKNTEVIFINDFPMNLKIKIFSLQ